MTAAINWTVETTEKEIKKFMDSLQELGISRRKEHMSPDGLLNVFRDTEGDFIVTVSDGRKTTSVEFVCHRSNSPAVIEGLKKLGIRFL